MQTVTDAEIMILLERQSLPLSVLLQLQVPVIAWCPWQIAGKSQTELKMDFNHFSSWQALSKEAKGCWQWGCLHSNPPGGGQGQGSSVNLTLSRPALPVNKRNGGFQPGHFLNPPEAHALITANSYPKVEFSGRNQFMEADVSSLACILLSKINCTTSKIDSNIKFIMTQINSACETWKGQLGTGLWQRHGSWVGWCHTLLLCAAFN